MLGSAEVVGAVETSINREKSAVITQARPQPQTPTKIAQPKPVRIAGSKSGDSVSPSSDPFVVGSLRDESKIWVKSLLEILSGCAPTCH